MQGARQTRGVTHFLRSIPASSRGLAARPGRALLLGIALAAAGGALAPGAHADAPGCNDQITRGVQAVHRGRVAQLSRCLRSGNYDGCNDMDSHTVAHENELRRYVAAEGSQCREAIDQGALLSEFGPASCPDEWNGCDLLVPSIDDPADLAECLVCGLHGHDLFIRETFGLPGAPPSDRKARRCNLNLSRTAGQAVRKGYKDIARCARGGEQPFDCTPDASEGTRFGKSVARVAAKVAKCRLDQGEAPETLAGVCGGVGDEAELASCLEGRVLCLVCRAEELSLRQGIDCAAFSGTADCDGAF